jgi:ABC-2 type transport system ATP-binding protein
MAETQIVVHNLSKTYRVPEREPGLAASFRSLVRRTYRDVEAVRDVSFTVEAGEMVGFIGPNGAGKTTTLKMLSGLLHPTAGQARVLGCVP